MLSGASTRAGACMAGTTRHISHSDLLSWCPFNRNEDAMEVWLDGLAPCDDTMANTSYEFENP